MIKNIVEAFWHASQYHKEVNGFAYEIPSKIVGNGEDLYPMVVLEEPVRISPSFKVGVSQATINVTVTTNEDGSKVGNQAKCEKILYDIIAYVNEYLSYRVTVNSADIVSLSKYNDDSTDGVRATLQVAVFNDYNVCIEDKFDTSKEFDDNSPLPDINTSSAEGCNNLFNAKLPVF